MNENSMARSPLHCFAFLWFENEKTVVLLEK